MSIASKNINFRWIITGSFFIAYFLYFYLFNCYHLIYLEQIQLFSFKWNFFADFITRPGGFSEYSGAFLTQFFLFPFAGASIVTLAGFAVYSIAGYIFHKYRLAYMIWALIPALLLAALHSSYNYTLAYSIGLIISLGFFAVNLSIENNRLRHFLVLIGWPIIYIIAGGYAHLAILLCIIHELLFKRDSSLLMILLIYPLFALSIPYLASQFIFYIKEGEEWTYFLPLFIGEPYKYILIILIIFFPVILSVVRVLSIYSKGNMLSTGWNLKFKVAGTVALICLSAVLIRYSYDRKTEILLGIDHCVQISDWNGALKLSSTSPAINRMIMHFTNLALFKTGHMGDQLFNYPQSGSDGLWLDWKQDWLIAFFGGEIYYHLAYNSEAYRWAFEAMVAKGPNPRSLKRLVMTSLVNNDIKLADKFLNILNKTLFYRKWAQHYLTYVNNPERLAEDKEISEKRHFEIHSDFISSDNFGVRLPQLLADHSDNRMAFEYLMAALLLDKNLEGFASNIYRLKDLGYKSIPVHYEEALLAYMSHTRKNIVPDGYTISHATMNRLSEYASAVYSYGDNMEMAARSMYGKFGETYWYYLKFINNQPH